MVELASMLLSCRGPFVGLNMLIYLYCFFGRFPMHDTAVLDILNLEICFSIAFSIAIILKNVLIFWYIFKLLIKMYDKYL